MSGVAGTVPYIGGWAVPLRGETPTWYTAQLAAQVHAAAGVPVAAPTDAPLPRPSQANEFGWDGAAIFGDSGSAVRVGTGLAAAGDLTHLVVDTTWLPSFIAGTRISKIQQIAGGWTLASSPLCV